MRKLKKWKKQNPPNNINPKTGEKLLDESHIVVFVNEDYLIDFQQVSIIDCVARWFFSWTSSPEAMQWNTRKSEPIVYKVSSTRKMHELINDGAFMPSKKTISYIAGDPVAICVGPTWSSELIGYNNSYERVYY